MSRVKAREFQVGNSSNADDFLIYQPSTADETIRIQNILDGTAVVTIRRTSVDIEVLRIWKDSAWEVVGGADSYTLSFEGDGSQLVYVSRSETLDLGNAANVIEDGTAGAGSLSFEKNGAAVSGSTAFSSGDVLKVTLSGSSAPTAVSIDRTLT